MFSSRRFVGMTVIFLVVSMTFATSFASGQRYNSYDQRNYNRYDGFRGDYGTSYQGFSGRSFSNSQHRPAFETYYGGNDLNTYWPVFSDPAACFAREDLLLQVAPLGCQPSVVRSDLLAEQDVPVFCQLDALKINPLIDVNQIRNIRFTGDTPVEVAGFGFHPARAALRTHDRLLGSPLVNNVGYVVVLLRRQPQENLLPELVNLSLNAEIEYVSENAFGVGRAEFLLDEIASDEEWERERAKQSFWNGRYFVRLEEVDPNFATVSIYQGDRRVMTRRVERGERSDPDFLPGLYCRAGLEIAYDSFTSAEETARIEVSSGNGVDSFDVVEGSRFLDDRCRIRRIHVDDTLETGFVEGDCRGDEFVLVLKPRGRELFNTFVVNGSVQEPERSSDGSSYTLDLRALPDRDRAGTYVLDGENALTRIPVEGEGYVVVFRDGGLNGDEVGEHEEWFVNLWEGLQDYRDAFERDSSFRLGSFVNYDLSIDSQKYFEEAIRQYERVADEYPNTKQADFEGSLTYGEIALEEAIALSRDFGMDSTQAGMINRLLESYPSADNSSFYAGSLNELFRIDSTLASESVQFDDQVRTIRLLDVSEPSEKRSVVLDVEGRTFRVFDDNRTDLLDGGRKVGELVIDDLDPDRALIGAYCISDRANGDRFERKRTFSFSVGGRTQEVCGVTTGLDDVTTRELARIRLLPQADRTRTQTNFSVAIGIEKRAIELTPDKARQKIEDLNETIEDWSEVSENLGDVVDGMKGACLATGAALTFKNFLSGLSGEALARQKVMNGEEGWRNWCREQEAAGVYDSIDACYLANDAAIDADVQTVAQAVRTVNEDIEQFQEAQRDAESDVFGESLDDDLLREDLAAFARERYGNEEIDVSGLRDRWVIDGERRDSVRVDELLSSEYVASGVVTTDSIREVMLQAELRRQGASGVLSENNEASFVSVARRLNENRIIAEEIARVDQFEQSDLPSPMYVAEAGTQSLRPAKVVEVGAQARERFGFSDQVTHVSTVRVFGRDVGVDGDGFGSFEQGLYVLGLEGGANDVYSIREVSRQSSAESGSERYTSLDSSRVPTFGSVFGIGNVRDLGGLDYNSEIVREDRVVKYYETEPYAGMPAIVPFDVRGGWYAATRQTLPAFGGIGAFDASGRVTSFWMCHVGGNGRIEFESGFGDDLCQQVNLQTGQPLEQFPGLSTSAARSLTNRAIRAIEDAARQHGNRLVSINGESFETAISVGQPGTECQDFMSPSDCHLLFNICDPVVCPTSRCDLGGTHPVANVAQTGIAGSVFLCLPNIREGIVIPVCLSGIQAGIDGLLSVMRGYQGCLQEHIDTGEVVGICDEVYSVYLCDFFWGQVAPFVEVLVPKLLESAYGQGVRGGAEYLTVASAWQNMRNSIDFFTQSYAVNSVNAFKVGGVQEVGAEFCQSWVSAKAPRDFETFVEPDSPPQFHAWFDSRRFSDATVPATAQYKVFYHIFAGKNTGAYFNVFLRDPPESSYYLSAQQVPVASGYIERGGFASETRDFTAPEGYKELCVRVNGQEECGFGRVTTSFALDYLNDQYVADEVANGNVQSERECVSGGAHPVALLNPNVQAGVEETVSPAVYDRGLVRICASENPGLGSDPGRFVRVGECDDVSIGCWLDKNSVSDAISATNVLALNESLEVLEQRTIEMLQAQGRVLEDSDAIGEIRSVQGAVESLKHSPSRVADLEELERRIDLVFDRLVWNHHKAELVLTRARANRVVAEAFKADDDAKRKGDRSETAIVGRSEGAIVCVVGYEAVDVDGDGREDICEAIEGFEEEDLGDELEEDVGEDRGSSPGVVDRVGTSREELDGISCEISNPRWVDPSGSILTEESVIVEGEEVVIVADQEGCEDEDLSIIVAEADPFGSSTEQVTIDEFDFVGPTLEARWDAEYVDDWSGEPEFVFSVVDSDSEVISDDSPELSVVPAEGDFDSGESDFFSLRETSSSFIREIFLGEAYTGISLEQLPGSDLEIYLNGLVIGSVREGIIQITDSEALESRNGIYLVQLDGRVLEDLERGIISFDGDFSGGDVGGEAILSFSERLSVSSVQNEYFVYFITSSGERAFTSIQLGENEGGVDDRAIFYYNEDILADEIVGVVSKPIHSFVVGDRFPISIRRERLSHDVLDGEFTLGDLDGLELVRTETEFLFLHN